MIFSRRDFVALFAGALLPLSFAPIHIFPLAIISLSLLFWVWLDASPKQTVIRGYLFGISYFGIGVSWIAISMYRFGGMSMPLASTLTVIFILIWATIPAAVGYFSLRFFPTATKKIRLMVILPAMWLLFEWTRGWLFTGFPWVAVGYSQVDSPLIGIAPILGVYGVSFAVSLTASSIVCAIAFPKSASKYLGFSVGLWLIAFVLSFVEWSDPIGTELKASLIQGNVHQSVKWNPEQRQPTIDLYTKLTQENWASDVIIWPETALPAYYHQAESFLQWLGETARKNNSDILIGMPVVDQADPSKYYNSVVTVGQDSGIFRKKHLVPFGEFLPLKSIFGNLLAFFNIPMANFSEGDADQALLRMAGHDIGVSICYEDVFGEEVIESLPNAKFLINVSNDAWFGDSLSPHQHLQMAQMRSIETARPMLRATNNGVSAIINHKGKLLDVSPQFETHVLSAEFQPMQGTTPYVLVGNWLIIPFVVLLLFVVYVLNHRNKK